MLNYAYGVLESQVRMQVRAAGLDPTIGILHGNARGQHGLVYDLMERLRPIVDRKVLEFVQSRIFHPADFTLSNNGMCRLNPELARSCFPHVSAGRAGIIDGPIDQQIASGQWSSVLQRHRERDAIVPEPQPRIPLDIPPTWRLEEFIPLRLPSRRWRPNILVSHPWESKYVG